MLAVVPVRDGVLPAGGLEVAAECGNRCIVIGSGAAAAADEIAASVDVDVLAAEAGDFRPGAWAEALAAHVRSDATGATVVVLPGSPDGRDLAPRIAAALGVPLLAGAVSVSRSSVVLARAGGLQMHAVSPPPPSFVATLQPGVRGLEPPPVASSDVRRVELDVEPHARAAADPTVLEVLAADAATIDLAESKRILGGGAGLAGPERFNALAELGEVLGASVGATRVITDRGWIGHERQIGTTGVVVDPDLYVAFGISGAVQHTSGLGQPQHIISVNTDPHCPMMQLADLAVVADANLVLDELRGLLVSLPDGVAGDG